ncbi:MAG: LuxR C-terminal-related transcriptional regulator [Rubricoccaceae bacterium]
MWLSPCFGALALQAQSRRPCDRLSKTERDVWALLVTGRSNEEIATELCLSVGTVKNAVTKVFRKMGVRNRPQALAAALGGLRVV